MVNTRGEGRFYNHYHQKNRAYQSTIDENNFTYFYWLKQLKRFVASLENVRVLDVGCGVGSLSLYCARHGAKVTGIDISDRAITIAKNAAQAQSFSHQPIFLNQTISSKLGCFDLVICSEVIEHVPDEKNFAKQLMARVAPGGTLIVSTPYPDNWLRQHNLLKQFDQQVGHQRLISAKQLKTLFVHPDFHTIAALKTEGPLRMLLFSTKAGILIKGIKGPLIWLFHAFDHLIARLFGWHDQWIILKRHA